MQTQINKIDFKDQKIYIGFDVHLKSWRVTILTEKLSHKTFSQPPKPEVLSNYLLKNFPGGTYYSAYEAGFCGYWIHNRLLELGINSIVVNPADIPTTGKEKVMKTDSRDSVKIARSLRNGDLQPIFVLSSTTLEDRGLVRMRATLVKDLTRYQNRIRSFLYFHGTGYLDVFNDTQGHWSKRLIKRLENLEFSDLTTKVTFITLLEQMNILREAVLKITKQVHELAKTDRYQERVKLLRSIPGIGLITAMVILTEIETINRFTNIDQLCGFIGLIPSTHSSGDTEINGKITPRGHSILRNAIIESSWTAAQHDPALNKSYHQYCRRMESNKAIIRIARKVCARISFVLKNNQSYVCSVAK